MRYLDTREQKSPRFLLDAFPDMEITPLIVGDYLSAEKKEIEDLTTSEVTIYPQYPNGQLEWIESYKGPISQLFGNLVE